MNTTANPSQKHKLDADDDLEPHFEDEAYAEAEEQYFDDEGEEYPGEIPADHALVGELPMARNDGDVENLERARPIPRISIQVFCEYPETAEAIQAASQDRRLSKAHVAIHMGGIGGAIANYQEAPTPNLVIVECGLERNGMLAELDRLSEYCDAGTKVIVIGHVNDVLLYRELVRRGVSEYVIAPIRPLQIMESISNLYNDPESDPVGHVLAFVGAKGGSGSSTICHNVAWTLSEIIQSDVVIADLDLPFGTAGLDFNQDPVQGIADALASPDRLDEVLLDRLLSKITDYLSLFAAPGTLDRNYEIAPEAYEWVIDVVRQNVPYLALDVPHVWTPWTRQQLLQADEVVVVATPDLASLRNAKNMIDLLKEHRHNDRPPHLVVNMVGLPKRPEIPTKDFAEALGIEPRLIIDFDGEMFGQAANNGQMIAELNEKSKAADQFRQLALILSHRAEMRKAAKPSVLTPLLQKLKLRKSGA